MNPRKQYLLDQEVKRLQAKFGQNYINKVNAVQDSERVTRDVAKAFLLDGDFLWNGEMYSPKQKHLGLGVYQISIEPKKY